MTILFLSRRNESATQHFTICKTMQTIWFRIYSLSSSWLTLSLSAVQFEVFLPLLDRERFTQLLSCYFAVEFSRQSIAGSGTLEHWCARLLDPYLPRSIDEHQHVCLWADDVNESHNEKINSACVKLHSSRNYKR